VWTIIIFRLFFLNAIKEDLLPESKADNSNFVGEVRETRFSSEQRRALFAISCNANDFPCRFSANNGNRQTEESE
jgi:hypothetical protein